MLTELEKYSEKSAEKAAQILKSGGIVAIPTETVYGLAANALDENAVRSIFVAKGRPQDNPLIVHISSFEMIKPLVTDIPELAKRLAERFWAGPLTMIFDRTEVVPEATSGGSTTVAVRMPANEAAREIIEKCGFPLAAPSANTSGKPSPTTAAHVFEDMNGKIPLIIDGGECSVGVESTVICFRNEKIHILRPGGITREMLAEFAEVEVDKAVEAAPKADEKVLSPGMKYKHYSPAADIILVDSDLAGFTAFVGEHCGSGVYALVFDGEENEMPCKCLTYGADSLQQAHFIFQKLRELDRLGAEKVYVRAPSKEGVGLAVYNRLIRAAGFEVIRI